MLPSGMPSRPRFRRVILAGILWTGSGSVPCRNSFRRYWWMR
jgi:hypothetical protein